MMMMIIQVLHLFKIIYLIFFCLDTKKQKHFQADFMNVDYFKNKILLKQNNPSAKPLY